MHRAVPCDAVAMTPSPSLLCWLCADELVHIDYVFEPGVPAGVPVPGRESQVVASTLAAHLFAAALWDLRERGLLTLAITTEGRAVALAPRVPAPPRPATGGIDATICTLISRSFAPPRDAAAVVAAWFGTERRNPDDAVLSAVAEEAVAAGILRRLTRRTKPDHQFVLANSSYEPDPARIATLGPALTAFRRRWRRFGREEGALLDALLRECDRGIRGSRDTSISAGDVDDLLFGIGGAHGGHSGLLDVLFGLFSWWR